MEHKLNLSELVYVSNESGGVLHLATTLGGLSGETHSYQAGCSVEYVFSYILALAWELESKSLTASTETQTPAAVSITWRSTRLP